MEEKIYKPKSCKDCPAVKIEKGMLVCGCLRELKSNLKSQTEQKTMWEKCPIDWDKEN